MRKLINSICIGIVGCEVKQALQTNDTDTDEQIQEMAWDQAIEWAQMYGEVTEDDFAEEEDDYTGTVIPMGDIEAFWEDYDPEKHDGHKQGGGSFEDDFRE